MHRIAFSAPAVQLTAADIEKTAYKARYNAKPAENEGDSRDGVCPMRVRGPDAPPPGAHPL